jgi:hypothetical protein
MIVVNPHRIAWSVACDHLGGELAVHSSEFFQAPELERELTEERMEERPEHRVGGLFVVAPDLVGRKRNWNEATPFELGSKRRAGFTRLDRAAGPTDPPGAVFAAER